ncbi:hypothetical protein AAVH_22443 [Aphelenchoides avenae]|nr:hypothetical protein AAVH_22443 [Aphelenchus avenae]
MIKLALLLVVITLCTSVSVAGFGAWLHSVCKYVAAECDTPQPAKDCTATCETFGRWPKGYCHDNRCVCCL